MASDADQSGGSELKLTCPTCHGISIRALPYDMTAPDSCDLCSADFPKLPPRPDRTLQRLADLYRDRNAQYGDSYMQFGEVVEAMFPNGLRLKSADDWNRFSVFFLMLTKVHRYAMRFHDGGQKDSLDDISVYSQMLVHLDALIKAGGGE